MAFDGCIRKVTSIQRIISFRQLSRSRVSTGALIHGTAPMN